jgi:DNA-binding transcriptional LysR family regulator
MTQPAVSEAIDNLEHILRVRLLDRGPRGIEPTVYADAVLKRSAVVFDELRQSVSDIESLADPTTGQVSIGSSISISMSALPSIVQRFSKKYPHVVLHIEDIPSSAIKSPGLRDRSLDLVFARWPNPTMDEHIADDLNVETLFDDPLVVAAGMHSPWARRRRIDLAELANESWILAPPRTWNYQWIAQGFKARGLKAPKVGLFTFNAYLNAHFLNSGSFLTAYSRLWARLNGLKVLPVELPLRSWPVSIVTLKHKTLSPAAARFIEGAREVAKSIDAKLRH